MDGSSCVLLTTNTAPTKTKAFVYDLQGHLLRSQEFAQLAAASAVGISADGSSLLISGWQTDSVTDPQARVTAMLVDDQGNIGSQFQVPPIGPEVSIHLDLATGDFILSNGAGQYFRIGHSTPPISFGSGTGLVSTAVASNAGLVAVATLEPVGPHTSHTHLVLRLFDRGGAPIFDRTLGGNTDGLQTPAIWLSSDGNFVAVRFADEIRYYLLKQ